MHDPYQNYQTLGAYSAAVTPFGLPYGSQPISTFATPGLAAYGIHPHQLQQLQQLQLMQQLQGQTQVPTPYNPFGQIAGVNPLSPGLPYPLLQHALVSPWQNPLLAAALHCQLANPQLANPIAAWPQQQFAYPLAPQSLIGSGVPYGGNPIPGGPIAGAMHPVAAPWAVRPFGASAVSPFAC